MSARGDSRRAYADGADARSDRADPPGVPFGASHLGVTLAEELLVRHLMLSPLRLASTVWADAPGERVMRALVNGIEVEIALRPVR